MPTMLLVLLAVLVIVVIAMAIRDGALKPPYDPLRVLLWVVVLLIAVLLVWPVLDGGSTLTR